MICVELLCNINQSVRFINVSVSENVYIILKFESICKIRVSAHSLNIETGRYKNIIRPETKCTNCSKGDIEDEKHFIVDCPLYENIRVKFVDKVIDLFPNFRYMNSHHQNLCGYLLMNMNKF